MPVGRLPGFGIWLRAFVCLLVSAGDAARSVSKWQIQIGKREANDDWSCGNKSESELTSGRGAS